MLVRTLIFLAINFGGLYLGSLFTNTGVSSDWYTNLNKAPWTPPGWVFGFAWTTIMICFSVFMAKLSLVGTKEIWILFILQFLLNVLWNPAYFHFQNMDLALIIIISLTVIVSILGLCFKDQLGAYALLIMPYFVWLIIADSLNLYTCLYN
ncbi:tryptophan-rich sensory protein [Flavobacteriaceae bacterium]|nr:tryptophan-rich sensory protein [Flavobacteriaceae bacterium]